ncbi:hypothetical protein EDC04DRAFT_2933589, partial [Pisolithus marmoratus]
VQHMQYPITPAYAFTDYHLQGQMISHVIMDIVTPPTGALNLFNLHIALPRSSSHATIQLLRDFDAKIFLCAHSAELLMEDDHLADL